MLLFVWFVAVESSQKFSEASVNGKFIMNFRIHRKVSYVLDLLIFKADSRCQMQ
jgi:hypothetical protein